MPVYITMPETLMLTQMAIASLGEVDLCIVDNGSIMGGGWLRSVANTYIRNKENLGYAKAVNQGLKLSKNILIAVANNDIRVSSNWQKVAREVFITPQVYSCHFKMTDYDTPFTYGDKIAYTGKERWCTSSFFVINTEQVLFYYDENFLNSYDDWDYQRTVRLAKFITAYTDKASYQHQHSHTQQLISGREETNKRNSTYFQEKWGDTAENLFAKDFPDQMLINYWEGFNI